MLLVALAALSLALVLLLGILWRISRNVGPLDLEDYARRQHVVFLPVSEQLVKELQTWSKPVRMRIETHKHPLLGELVCTTTLDEQPATPAA